MKFWRTGRLEALAIMVIGTALSLFSGELGWGSQTEKTNELPADTLIVLHRGACERRCAVYNVIIFADGSAIFDGRHYVRRPDVVRTSVGLEVVGKLLDEAKVLGFFDLRERYAPGMVDDCDTVKSDAPTAIVSIISGGKSKTIVHYHGCMGSESARLMLFEEKIDRAINAARWLK